MVTSQILTSAIVKFSVPAGAQLSEPSELLQPAPKYFVPVDTVEATVNLIHVASITSKDLATVSV